MVRVSTPTPSSADSNLASPLPTNELTPKSCSRTSLVGRQLQGKDVTWETTVPLLNSNQHGKNLGHLDNLSDQFSVAGRQFCIRVRSLQGSSGPIVKAYLVQRLPSRDRQQPPVKDNCSLQATWAASTTDSHLVTQLSELIAFDRLPDDAEDLSVMSAGVYVASNLDECVHCQCLSVRIVLQC